MNTRMRSPSYPSTPLGDAIDLAEKIYRSERTNAVDRAVAAQAMGYTGVTGHTAKLLSDLTQYGFLEKTGKSEVRVARRLINIVLPDDPSQKIEELKEAIQEPELFNRLGERFPDGLPSTASLKAALMKEGFTDAAIPSAASAYLKSYDYLQTVGVCDSNGRWIGGGSFSLAKEEDQREMEHDTLLEERPAQRSGVKSRNQRAPIEDTKPTYFFDGSRIELGGAVLDQEQAEQVIQFMNAVKMMLPARREDQSPPDN